MSSKEYRPLPVDFTILEMLPDKGMVGGVHWRGRQVIDLVTEINEGLNGTTPGVTSSFIQGRLRAMNVAGYVAPFGSTNTGSKAVWARLPAGKDWLGMKEKVLG